MSRSLLLTILLLGAFVAAPAALAQIGVDLHRLEITDGRVFHDGVEIPADDLPEGFDPEGISFTFEYTGPVVPALTIDGRVYAIDGQRLVALDDATDADEPRAMAVMPMDGRDSGDTRRRQAEEAYMENLSERDRALYERLLNEREMEEESVRLAYALREADDEDRRSDLKQRLRRQIEAIFEIKQQNRREEIQQVEMMLDNMREQLLVRESHREAIIDRRVGRMSGSD